MTRITRHRLDDFWLPPTFLALSVSGKHQGATYYVRVEDRGSTIEVALTAASSQPRTDFDTVLAGMLATFPGSTRAPPLCNEGHGWKSASWRYADRDIVPYARSALDAVQGLTDCEVILIERVAARPPPLHTYVFDPSQ